MKYHYLKINEVIEFHDLLIANNNGLEGIRDMKLLESAIESPKMQFAGDDLYPDLFKKAVAYLYFIIKNHPFNDCNKRTGVMSFLVFLKINNYPIEYLDKIYLEDIAVTIASSDLDIKSLEAYDFWDNKVEFAMFDPSPFWPDRLLEKLNKIKNNQ